MIKILVDTQEEKDDLIKASKYLHNLRNINSDIPMINTLMHLYQAPDIIEIKQKKD